jgi:hypothetical protein
LFEALARQAKFILVVDASADGERTLSDLGTADRLGTLDLNANFKFDADQLSEIRKKESGCAVGTVEYFDCSGNPSHTGMIVLVKPSAGNTESTALLSYELEHHDFPHESTLDQWFSEAQFAAYLILGRAAVDDLLVRQDLKAHFPPKKKG